jgi:hypothetical protein
MRCSLIFTLDSSALVIINLKVAEFSRGKLSEGFIAPETGGRL